MAVRVPAVMRRIRSTVRGRPRLPARLSPRRARIFAFLGLLGPGLIAANAGNDAGGIATYSSVGAKYGYELLWTMVLITISLALVQLLAARMGVVTGKGLAELVREEYGIRWSVLATSAVLIANLGICISDFVGVGAALGLAGMPAQVSVPIAAVGIWLIIVRGSYRSAERIFIWFTIPFFAYPIAAILAHPEWGEVAKGLVVPQIHTSPAFLVLLVALTGTTITPYMQLYLQSAVVERGVRVDELPHEEREAVAGADLRQRDRVIHHHRDGRHAVHTRRPQHLLRGRRGAGARSRSPAATRRCCSASGCWARACSRPRSCRSRPPMSSPSRSATRRGSADAGRRRRCS